MAKKHMFNRVSLTIGTNQIEVKNQNVKLRYSLEYGVKHDGSAVSTDYTNIFDLEMPLVRMLELCKNSVTIKWQNDVLRKIPEDKGKKWNHEVVTYENVFPGKSAPKPLTTDDMIKMLKNLTGCNIFVTQNGRIWIRGDNNSELLSKP